MMTKKNKIILASIVFIFSVQVLTAQPQFPCAPGTECLPPPAPCTQQSDCSVVSDPDPIGDAIPLDGASSILLLIGAGIALSKRLKIFHVKTNS